MFVNENVKDAPVCTYCIYINHNNLNLGEW